MTYAAKQPPDYLINKHIKKGYKKMLKAYKVNFQYKECNSYGKYYSINGGYFGGTYDLDEIITV